MTDNRNILPVLVDLATRIAGEDLTGDVLRTVRGGPSSLKVYTPADLNLADVSLATAKTSPWIDVTGYRVVAAFFRLSGTYGGTQFGLDLLGSPVGPGDTWGGDNEWAVSLANRSNLSALGSYMLANTGTASVAPPSSFTGGIARKVRVDIGAAGASAFGKAYLLCLP